MNKLVTLQKACEILGISSQTIRRWEREGKISCVRTQGNQRRVPMDEIHRILGTTDLDTDQQITLLYARCSTSKQKDNHK